MAVGKSPVGIGDDNAAYARELECLVGMGRQLVASDVGLLIEKETDVPHQQDRLFP